MELIQFHSFSSAWYWFTLIAIWVVFCQLYLGMSYHQLRLARQRHPERQGVLLRALALYLERMRWSTVSYISPFVAGLCAFVLSFWSVVAFYYNVEILQALFFLRATVCVHRRADKPGGHAIDASRRQLCRY